VLPLQNLSGDPQQEYFADGITDELTTDLAQISALRVTSRTSAMQFRETKEPLPQIGKQLSGRKGVLAKDVKDTLASWEKDHWHNDAYNLVWATPRSATTIVPSSG